MSLRSGSAFGSKPIPGGRSAYPALGTLVDPPRIFMPGRVTLPLVNTTLNLYTGTRETGLEDLTTQHTRGQGGGRDRRGGLRVHSPQAPGNPLRRPLSLPRPPGENPFFQRHPGPRLLLLFWLFSWRGRHQTRDGSQVSRVRRSCLLPRRPLWRGPAVRRRGRPRRRKGTLSPSTCYP